MEPAGKHFLQNARFEFERMKTLADKSIARLNDEEFLKKLSAESNSVHILVQHISGNLISRFTDFLTSDGEKSWRNRDSEFEEQTFSRNEVMKRWEDGWKILFETIDALTPDQLLQNVVIRNEKLTVMQALLRQVSHYSYHVGQIVQLAKEWKGEKWESLSIPKGKSAAYNRGDYLKK